MYTFVVLSSRRCAVETHLTHTLFQALIKGLELQAREDVLEYHAYGPSGQEVSWTRSRDLTR